MSFFEVLLFWKALAVLCSGLLNIDRVLLYKGSVCLFRFRKACSQNRASVCLVSQTQQPCLVTHDHIRFSRPSPEEPYNIQHGDLDSAKHSRQHTTSTAWRYEECAF